MDYVTEAASRAGQLVVSAAQNGVTLSDAQIQQYGRYAMAASALYYVSVTFKDPVPADAKYAIDAHIPSGFDRSIIAARLSQRHTKHVLEATLGLKRLRESVRTEATRDGKLALWSQILETTLVGIVAAAYTHSLTLSLWALKNTSRVLIFVLRKREAAEEQRRTTPHRGLQGKFRTWWQGGTQGLITDTLLKRMAEQVEKQASPFATSGIHDDEEDAGVLGAGRREDGEESTADEAPRSGAYGYADHAATPVRDRDTPGTGSGSWSSPTASPGAGGLGTSAAGASADAQAFLNGEFSIHRLLDVAIPRIVACARAAVADVMAHLPAEHALDMTGNVRGTTLQYVFTAIVARMERTACVPAWLQSPPPSSSATRSAQTRVMPLDTVRTGGLGGAADEADEDEEDEEDIIDYPIGSTVLLGPDGRPLSLGRDGSTGRSRSLLEELGTDPALHHQVTEAQRAAEEESARREQLARQQTVGFFQEVIHHDSFAELVLLAGEAHLVRAFREARDVSCVRGYDVVTDSCKLLLAVTSLEACRQKMNDADFAVPPHLKLFCEELVRSTCSQRMRS